MSQIQRGPVAKKVDSRGVGDSQETLNFFRWDRCLV